MQHAHPKVIELAVKENIGFLEAEDRLRFLAQKDQGAATAIKEIDDRRADARQAKLAANQEAAEALGLSLDQADALIEKMWQSPDLLTWLSGRVHLAMLHERMPAANE